MGRRKIGLDDDAAWVFNRMAHVYDARPSYPSALIDALAALSARVGPRVADLGAGIGHLALPLAERGLSVSAIEPARAMLARLEQASRAASLSIRAFHATAESLPLADRSIDLVIVADALHFLDAELTGREIARVLVPNGALSLLTCEFGATTFMRALRSAMEQAAPRRPRATVANATQLAALAGVRLTDTQIFHDETPIDREQLERILGSISFIGPAMNSERSVAFRQVVRGLSEAPIWSRTFTLQSGTR